MKVRLLLGALLLLSTSGCGEEAPRHSVCELPAADWLAEFPLCSLSFVEFERGGPPLLEDLHARGIDHVLVGEAWSGKTDHSVEEIITALHDRGMRALFDIPAADLGSPEAFDRLSERIVLLNPDGFRVVGLRDASGATWTAGLSRLAENHPNVAMMADAGGEGVLRWGFHASPLEDAESAPDHVVQALAPDSELPNSRRLFEVGKENDEALAFLSGGIPLLDVEAVRRISPSLPRLRALNTTLRYGSARRLGVSSPDLCVQIREFGREQLVCITNSSATTDRIAWADLPASQDWQRWNGEAFEPVSPEARRDDLLVTASGFEVLRRRIVASGR